MESKKQKTEKGMAKKLTIRASRKYQIIRSLIEPTTIDFSPRGWAF
jgi:hypothetical protein